MYFAGEGGNDPHHAAVVSSVTGDDIFYFAHTEARKGDVGLSQKIGNETVIIIRIRY